jgi:hypothetical protein
MSSSVQSLETRLQGRSSPESALHGDMHKYHRFFIGPMPDKVLSSTEAQLRKNAKLGLYQPSTLDGSSSDDVTLSQMIKDQSYHFFIREGGNAEDWGEREECITVDEMLKRWKESEWGQILQHRKKENNPTSHWIGSSFEVGDFLGVNTISNSASGRTRDRKSSQDSGNAVSASTVEQDAQALPQLFPAKSSPATLSTFSAQQDADSSCNGNVVPASPDIPGADSISPNSATSSTALLSKAPPIANGGPSSLRPFASVPEMRHRSSLLSRQKSKGKQKMVHYNDPPVINARPSTFTEANTIVTERGPEENPVAAATERELQWGDVVMRGMIISQKCLRI